MSKRILLIFAFIVVFLAGVLIASIFHAGSPMVVIDFVNNSGKKIESIEIIQKFGRDEKYDIRFKALRQVHQRHSVCLHLLNQAMDS